jgi:hypothetical protein
VKEPPLKEIYINSSSGSITSGYEGSERPSLLRRAFLISIARRISLPITETSESHSITFTTTPFSASPADAGEIRVSRK